MDRKALKHYPKPTYPTRRSTAADPTLLGDNLPPGWQAEGAMAGAVAFFMAFSTAGCPTTSSEPAKSGAAPAAPSSAVPVVAVEPATSESPPPAAIDPVPRPAPAAAVVAPIFEHGEGRGAVGCVVVSPPVFLSEDEALTVIREELARQGIRLTKREVKMPEIAISRRQERYGQDPAGGLTRQESEVPGSATAVQLDAAAPTRHVVVEFVSRDDYFPLGGVRSGSTVQGYDLKDVATALAQRIAKDGKHHAYYGIFYDPMQRFDYRGRPGMDWRTAQAKLTTESKDMLRAQVKDFVNWLRRREAL